MIFDRLIKLVLVFFTLVVAVFLYGVAVNDLAVLDFILMSYTVVIPVFVFGMIAGLLHERNPSFNSLLLINVWLVVCLTIGLWLSLKVDSLTPFGLALLIGLGSPFMLTGLYKNQHVHK